MPFNSETASKAGKKSKRGPDSDTKKLRQAIGTFLDNNSERIEEWMDQVAKEDPKEALKIFKDMAEYALPKLQRTELKSEQDIQHTFDLTDEQFEKLVNNEW